MATTSHDPRGADLIGRRELDPEEARQGQITGHMRWVLAISVVLAIMVIFGSWAFLADKARVARPAPVNPPASSAPASQG
jgi:hypothetical protein